MSNSNTYNLTVDNANIDVQVENALGSQYPTYDDEALISFFNILPGQKVLDVGGGSKPFKRANVVTDLFFNETHHRGGAEFIRLPGIEYVQCDVTNLPFSDKEFDFVICRHVLEHVNDPIKACQELSRVSKRGFVEMPSRVNEYLHGYPNHLWLCDVKDGVLQFDPKPFIRNPFRNVTRKLHYTDPNFRVSFEYTNRNIFCTQLFWKDEISAKVLDKKPDIEYFNYDDPAQAAVAHLDYALNYMSFQLPQLDTEIESHLQYAYEFCPNNHIITAISELFAKRNQLDTAQYTQIIDQVQLKDLLSLVCNNTINTEIAAPTDKNYTQLLRSIYKKQENAPFVSVIVRTMDREDLLLRCLDSLDKQIYENIEIIVVNDGGKDLSSILKNGRRKYNYVQHAINLGRGASLNTGLKLARGKYISIVDDDDVFYPEHIALLVTALENTDCRAAYSDSILSVEDKVNDQWISVKKELQYSQPHDYQLLLRTNYLPILTVMFERSLLVQTGFVNEEYDVLEDWDFWIRVGRETKFYHIKQITSQYSQRVNGNNATQQLASSFSTFRSRIHQNYRQLMTDEPVSTLLVPQQHFDGKLVRFMFCPESLDNCKEVISVFARTFENTPWAGLYVFHPFDGEDVNKIIEESQTSESALFQFYWPEEKQVSDSLRHSFDAVIQTSPSTNSLGLGPASTVPVISVHQAIECIQQDPLFSRMWQQHNQAAPLVSLVILTKNQLEYTKKCIDSVFAYTRDPFEVIIVDNGSTDGTVSYLHSLSTQKQNVKVIFNDVNLGYGGGNNQGISHSSGVYVVLLNNDVIVTPQWIDRLVSAVESNPDYGIAGPVSNQVAGIQQVNDPIYSVDDLQQYAVKHSRKYDAQVTATGRVIGFCMLIKREVIDNIGGFDLRYGIGNFEDDDLCIRAGLLGYGCAIAHDVFIHHFGSVTFKGEDINYANLMTENVRKFLVKWQLPFPADGLFKGYRFDDIALSFDLMEHYSPLVGDATAENYLKQGVNLFAEAKYEQCEVALLSALQLEPSNKDIWHNLVIVYMQTMNWQNAEKCFEYLDETDVEVGHLKVICQLSNQKYDDASQLLRRLLKENPEHNGLLESLHFLEANKEDMNTIESY